MSNLNKLSRNLRDPVVSTMTGLFSHGPAPLANTLEILGSWALTRCHGTCSKMLQCSSGESRHSSSTPPTPRLSRVSRTIRPIAPTSRADCSANHSHSAGLSTNDTTRPLLEIGQ